MRRREMVLAVRSGSSLLTTARRFGVSLATVQFWVNRAKGRRLDRVDFAQRLLEPRLPANRKLPKIEQQLLTIRRQLKEQSTLGEHGASAIRQTFLARRTSPWPAVTLRR